MWKSGKDHIDGEKLDRFGDELLRAFEASDAEINTAATSPFLYRRIRARIEAEERRLAEQRSTWVALLAGAKRAVPVMAMLAIVAFVSLMIMPLYSQPYPAENGMNEETPTLLSDVFSFSPDDLLASAIGVEAGQPKQSGEKK
jgi:cytochrome c-type biogenesis protein CcmH/NrfG